MIEKLGRAVGMLAILASVQAWAGGKPGLLPSLAPLVDTMKAPVVNVEVQAKGSGPNDEAVERFFGFRPRRDGRESLRQGAGSGVIIDADGTILTNNHVVENAVTIRVRLLNGRPYDAEVVGTDPLTDLAVIRLKEKVPSLPVALLGDSAAMKPGDWVVAVGNPYGLSSSVSLGIISALDREIGNSPYDQFLQTDAAINPGNSGGPLYNLNGEVIGINTAIVGGASGIGFAVPSSVAKSLLPQLKRSGTVVRGYMGVDIQDLTPALAKAYSLRSEDGALVAMVMAGSPAQKAGLKEEDVVVAIDGDPVLSASALRRSVAMKAPGSETALSIVRKGKKSEVRVKLAERPKDRPDFDNRPSAPSEPTPRIGLSARDMDPNMAEAYGMNTQGALIESVVPGSVAEKAGLKRGSLVLEANHQAVRNRQDLVSALTRAKSGEMVILKTMEPPPALFLRLTALEIP